MLKNIINNIKDRFKVRTPNVQGFTKPGSNVRGVVDFDPKNLKFSSAVNNANTSGAFLQYPLDARDQEHYILIDIIERETANGHPSANGTGFNQNRTIKGENLRNIVQNTNRFFDEGGTTLGGLIPTGIGSKRTVKNTIAIYMPQTVKFNFAADYGSTDIGSLVGFGAKIKDFFASGNKQDVFAGLSAITKGLDGGVEFFSLGSASGLGAAIQRRTNIAPAAMTEMTFNGIDYRQFSFEFTFTPRNHKESNIVNNMLHYIKQGMLPEKYGSGSIAAFRVPNEFAIRFMRGQQVNPYLDQVGLCACTGVDITYGGDKFATHPQGDPVSINATISFRELELIDKTRYNDLRLAANGTGQLEIG